MNSEDAHSTPPRVPSTMPSLSQEPALQPPSADPDQSASAEVNNVAQALIRPAVPALDTILGKAMKVIDSGFIRVVDYMGSDASIVQAARVSYGIGTKRLHEDRGLIRYLLRNAHTTPFEMCEIKLHVRVPMDTWRQWIRHRTASVNEYSTRYSVAIDATQHTDSDGWRVQATTNRQGSAGMLPVDVGVLLSQRERELKEFSRVVYEERLSAGVAREQARKDLPLSTYTEAYWKVDLHNLLRFLRLRMDAHAQQEIRECATLIGERIVSQWVPATWEAFQDFQLGATTLSRLESQVITALVAHGRDAAIAVANKFDLLNRGDGGLRPNRERSELEAKLLLLGHEIPWLEQRDSAQDRQTTR